jgi:hypothetical protein
MVNTEDYKVILDKAVEELRTLFERQDQIADEWEIIGNRIEEVKQGILALAPLCGIQAQRKYAELFPEYNPFAPVGLNEAILTVLGRVEDDRFITPVAIRDGLKATGYETKSKNILPSIHTALKRLEGQRVESGDVNGKTGYRLIRADRPPKQNAFQQRLGKALQDAIHPPRRTLPNEGITVAEPLLPQSPPKPDTLVQQGLVDLMKGKKK